jgi:aspartate/methionine/tyrosine aminotransferase
MCRVPLSWSSSEAFADWLLENHGIGVAPGSSFAALAAGEGHGTEHYYRVALCGDVDRTRAAVERLCASLSRT